MAYTRLAYDDASTTTEMASDCAVAGQNLHLPLQVDRRSIESPMNTEFDDYSALATTAITVSDSLAELAAGMHLHLE